jgi:hypothetical protein
VLVMVIIMVVLFGGDGTAVCDGDLSAEIEVFLCFSCFHCLSLISVLRNFKLFLAEVVFFWQKSFCS